MRMAVLVVALIVSLTAAATWRAARHAPPPPSAAAVAVAPDPGWMPAAPPGRPAAAAPARRWECVVLHHSATEVDGAARSEQAYQTMGGGRGAGEAGYHFVIGNGSDTPDGRVEVTGRWVEQRPGAHCRSAGDYYNQHGVGVCLVGDLSRHPPTPAQRASLKRLLKFLCHQYAIPADHVYTHADIYPRTRCPGGQLDLAAARAGLR